MKKYALNLIVRYFAKVRIRKGLYKLNTFKKLSKSVKIIIYRYINYNTLICLDIHFELI